MISAVGIVVPTLGTRPELLQDCLQSIRQAGKAHICVVAPAEFDGTDLQQNGLIDQIGIDPNGGLAEAINYGISLLPVEIKYVNWLGDDDLLAPGALDQAEQALTSNSNITMVFGSCDYIDSGSQVIFTNKSGKWAVPLLRFGPDLVPQPGSLFRRSAFIKVNGLDTKLKWAFDLDLFIKLSTIGDINFIDKKLASFRWHPESLSVEFRSKSAQEASMVRKKYLPIWLRPISFIWENPVRLATVYAGVRVTARAKGRARL